MYKLREERVMKPATFAQMLSATLYERRFGPYFVSPVVAGLDERGTPYLAGMDSIGAIETAKDFMVAGTAQDSLYGMCESMYQPNLVCNSADEFDCWDNGFGNLAQKPQLCSCFSSLMFLVVFHHFYTGCRRPV